MATGSSRPPLSKAERDALAQDIDEAWDEDPSDDSKDSVAAGESNAAPAAPVDSIPPPTDSMDSDLSDEPGAAPAPGAAATSGGSARGATSEPARRRWPLWLAALLLAGVAVRFMSAGEPEPTPPPAEAERVKAKPPNEPVKPSEVATSRAARPAEPANTASAIAEESSEPALAAAASATRQQEPGATEVTVHVFPLEGQIYRKGHVIGTGAAKVQVPADSKELLLVLLDGYHPRKLVLDGKDPVVNVGLVKKSPAQQAPAVPVPSAQ